jgi:hypothetical protein
VHPNFTSFLQQDSCAFSSQAQSNEARTLLAQQSMTVLVSEQSPRKQECNSCT